MSIIHIASDHAGLNLKTTIKDYLISKGYEVVDHGTNSTQSCDYPIIAQKLCMALQESKEDIKGILICGTGIGMSIMANRYKDIRAALCCNEFHAQATREHNNANILCLGERVTGQGLALKIVNTFLATNFVGGRHQSRIDQFDKDLS